MGFEFPAGFVYWFARWLREAPSKELVQDCVFIMWNIWCAGNDASFNSNKPDVDKVMRCFSGVASSCRSGPGKLKLPSLGEGAGRVMEGGNVRDQELCFLFKKPGVRISHGEVLTFVVDGVWLAKSGVGAAAAAAAWVQEMDCGEARYQAVQCVA